VSSGAFVRKELREILRDRRAVFLTFVLPILLYPLMFMFSTSLTRREDAKQLTRVHDVAVTGLERFRQSIDADERVRVVDRADTTHLRDAVRSGEIEAWVAAPASLASGAPAEISIVYVASRPASSTVRDRIHELLLRERGDEALRRWQRAGGAGDPATRLGLRDVDVATAVEVGGARVGRLLPLFLIMTLFLAGTALAIDLVAGEKERGTLETLFLTPVPRSTIARSKYVVAFVGMVLAGIGNVGSLAFCYSRGWITTPGVTSAIDLSTTGVIASFVMIVPLAAIISGVLLGVSARARTLKEAQYYVMPITLLAFIPALFASSQEVHLDAFTAWIPIANVALAVRDSLLGALTPWKFVLVFGTSIVWGGLAMRWATNVLAREDTILGFDPEPPFGKTRDGRRRAALLGMSLTVLVFFYAGQWLQARDLKVGLLLTLWVLLPLCAAITLRLAWSGGAFRDVLSLRRPSMSAALAGPLLGAGLVLPLLAVIEHVQSRFLPMPEFMTDLGAELGSGGTWMLLFLAAFTPGVCEEIVFRGAFLGLLRRTGTTRAAILISSAFFGIIHLSVFRFLPTFLLGLVMGALTVRTRSIVPSMLFHMTYNGLVFFAAEKLEESAVPDAVLWGLSIVLLGVGASLAVRGARSVAIR
jgi:sodium transport system permease protein